MPDIVPVKALRVSGAFCVAAMLSACGQMTKHSNMLVFGTNTSVGVNVGKDASQTPTIQIGIQRQEVALVPLLANTGYVESNGADGKKYASSLVPCPAAEEAAEPPEKCRFVAKSTTTTYGKDGEPTVKTSHEDSYSTLASFGTKSSANGDGASVAVAQYFATGVAAQKLAENGGADVVQAASKSDAVAKAEADKATAEANKAAYEAFKLTKEQEVALAEYTLEVQVGERLAINKLGGAEADLTDAKLQALADMIGPNFSECTFAKFKALNKAEAKDLVAAIKTDNEPCLAKIGIDAMKGE